MYLSGRLTNFRGTRCRVSVYGWYPARLGHSAVAVFSFLSERLRRIHPLCLIPTEDVRTVACLLLHFFTNDLPRRVTLFFTPFYACCKWFVPGNKGTLFSVQTCAMSRAVPLFNVFPLCTWMCQGLYILNGSANQSETGKRNFSSHALSLKSDCFLSWIGSGSTRNPNLPMSPCECLQLVVCLETTP